MMILNASKEDIMAGKLYGIGVGPGDPKLLTLKAKEILEKCTGGCLSGEGKRRGEHGISYCRAGSRSFRQTDYRN